MNHISKQLWKGFGARATASSRGLGGGPVTKNSFPCQESKQTPLFHSMISWNARQPVAALRPFTSPFTGGRTFSTTTASTNTQQQQILSPTSPTMVTDSESGEEFGILLDTRKLPKLKPSIVQRRLAQCKTYVGRERNIRQSPWKLNRICQLAAGLTLEEALTQLKFCDLKNADLVAKVLRRTSNLADIRDGLQISQLEVAECFTTKAVMLRRIKPMGRGRYVSCFVLLHCCNFESARISRYSFPPSSCFLSYQPRNYAPQILSHSRSLERN